MLTVFGDHVHAPSTHARQWLIDVGHVPQFINGIGDGVVFQLEQMGQLLLVELSHILA